MGRPIKLTFSKKIFQGEDFQNRSQVSDTTSKKISKST